MTATGTVEMIIAGRVAKVKGTYINNKATQYDPSDIGFDIDSATYEDGTPVPDELLSQEEIIQAIENMASEVREVDWDDVYDSMRDG